MLFTWFTMFTLFSLFTLFILFELFTLLTLFTLFTLLTWFTLFTRGIRGTTMGKTGRLRPETPFQYWLSHAGSRSIFRLTVARACILVQEYFQIYCPMQVPRSIFQIDCRTRVYTCTGIFSNLLSHAGVQEYFRVECHTRGSRSKKYFLIDCRMRGSRSKEFSYRLWHAEVREYFQIECHMWGSRSFFLLQIECRTRVSRRIFKLNVVHWGPRKLEQWGR